MAALSIWNEIYSQCTIELSPQHALAMRAMWESHDGRNRISEDEAFKKTNKILQEQNINPLSEKDFAAVVNDLKAMKCVEIRNGIIWLREWVKRVIP